MLEYLIELAREYRARKIVLELRPTSRTALKFYRSMGFSAIGYRTG